jgi:hypothetical protein
MVYTPTGMPNGRPEEYDPIYCAELIADMKAGFSIAAFAGKIAVSRQSITHWLQKYPEFLLAASIGKSMRLRQWETALMNCAFTGKGNIGAISLGLKNAGRDDWKEVEEIVVTTRRDYSHLSDERLLAIIDALSAVDGGIPPEFAGEIETIRLSLGNAAEVEREDRAPA